MPFCPRCAMVFAVASNNCASRAVLNLAVHATTIAQLQSPLAINSVSETAWAYPVAARRFVCGRASFRLDSQFPGGPKCRACETRVFHVRVQQFANW
jgi:hypothetical protein